MSDSEDEIIPIRYMSQTFQLLEEDSDLDSDIEIACIPPDKVDNNSDCDQIDEDDLENDAIFREISTAAGNVLETREISATLEVRRVRRSKRSGKLSTDDYGQKMVS